jgi:hypothetical protein
VALVKRLQLLHPSGVWSSCSRPTSSARALPTALMWSTRSAASTEANQMLPRHLATHGMADANVK